MNIPSASSRQQDKNKLYHWPDFTPPQPQNAAASVAYFVTAVNSPNFSDAIYDPQDEIIRREVYKKGRGGCVVIF